MLQMRYMETEFLGRSYRFRFLLLIYIKIARGLCSQANIVLTEHLSLFAHLIDGFQQLSWLEFSIQMDHLV